MIERIYALLVGLYPASYKERFGEAMMRTFVDLCNERRLRGQGIGWFVFVTCAETSRAIAGEQFGRLLQLTATRANSRAVLRNLVLIAPFSLLFISLYFNFSPGIDKLLLRSMGNNMLLASRIGSLVVLALFGLVIYAAWTNIAVLVRAARTEQTRTTRPVALTFGTIALSIVLVFVLAIIIDQWPCWTGVPNCD